MTHALRKSVYLWLGACATTLVSAADVATTLAGGGLSPTLSAQSLAIDTMGTLYLTQGRQVLKVPPGGQPVIIAGNGMNAFSGDGGPATQASIQNPGTIALDASGALYLVDGNRVRRVGTDGIITTVAGNGSSGFSGDGGAATAASLDTPRGIAIDSAGALLIADGSSFRVRRVADGTITTVAGTGVPGGGGDSGSALALSVHPGAIASDGAGGFYFLDTAPNATRLRRVTSAGAMSTVSTQVSPITQSIFRESTGNLLLACGSTCNHVSRITPAGVRTIVAGTGGFPPGAGDGGPATSATVLPSGAVTNAAGEMFIADIGRLRVVGTDGIIRPFQPVGTVADACNPGGVPATNLRVRPVSTAVLPSGDRLLGLDRGCVIRIDGAGKAYAFAGTGVPGRSGDGGPATAAQVDPEALAVDAAGNVFIAGRERVRRVDTAGIITTVAGGGTTRGDGGPPTSASLGQLLSIALGGDGTLYISDGPTLRRVRGNVIDTIAGNGAFPAFPLSRAGEGGAAAEAPLSVRRIAVDGEGGVVFIDAGLMIRRVDPTGVLSTIAGDGTQATTGTHGDGGPAIAARFQQPDGLAIDPDGNIHVSDAAANRIRTIDRKGIIWTTAGTGVEAHGGDGGPALSAHIARPFALAWDAPNGGLLVVESGVIETDRAGHLRHLLLPDAMPDALAFAPVMGATIGSTIVSQAVVPAGFDAAATVSVTGGEHSVGCTGSFTSAAGTIAPGTSICVRHTAADAPNKDSVTVVAIGARDARFVSTTAVGTGALSITPAALAFGPHSMQATSPTQDFTVTNTGGVPVTINAVRTTTAAFEPRHACGTLAAGASCALSVGFIPRAEGPVSDTLTVQATSGDYTAAVGGTGERSFTRHYYRSILDRAADAPGLAFWDTEASRVQAFGANVNETWYSLAMTFFASPEYAAVTRTDAQYVENLYRTFFNRPSDDGGRAFWLAELAGGLPRDVLLARFMFSPEFSGFTARVFGSVRTRAEVDVVMDFYRGFFGRVPDDDGYQHWIARFRQAQCTGGLQALMAEAHAISKLFVESAEYAARGRSTAQYVGDLYNAFLRRGGDLAGALYWIGYVNEKTANVESARWNFVQSAEFTRRMMRVTAEGCLQ